MARFHLAAPYPGTPSSFQALRNGWFRPATRWEQLDMDRYTVLDCPNLPAQRLEYGKWAPSGNGLSRPGPMLTHLKGFNSWEGIRSAIDIGLQYLSWISEGPMAGGEG